MPNKLSAAKVPCAKVMKPPPMIIKISKLEAVLVRLPIPAMPKVKIQGHSVLQNKPTEMKANTLTYPELKIPMMRAKEPSEE